MKFYGDSIKITAYNGCFIESLTGSLKTSGTLTHDQFQRADYKKVALQNHGYTPLNLGL